MTCEMGNLNDEDLVISRMRSRAVVLKLHYVYPLVYLIDFFLGGGYLGNLPFLYLLNGGNLHVWGIFFHILQVTTPVQLQ